MRAHFIGLGLVVLVTCSLTSAVMAQSTTITYTIHVDFFAYACSLDITKVSLYDSSGGLVGVASSPYGGEIAVSIRSLTPITTLTATAYGQATWGSYYSWQVSGSRSITLSGNGDYWITIRMS